MARGIGLLYLFTRLSDRDKGLFMMAGLVLGILFVAGGALALVGAFHWQAR